LTRGGGQLDREAKDHQDKDAIQVRLWSWHLIGGALREWTDVFKPADIKATSKERGRFGGGGYD